MNVLISHLQTVFNNFGPFFILLGILIFVHELGHFLVAKFFGVRVETFSLGFGKKILCFKRGDTVYALSLIPLGGYVKMYGDDPSADIPFHEARYAFLRKPVLQRFAIVLAGPLMNLFFAIFVFSAIVGLGEEVPGPWIGDVAADSKAFEAGFRSGDKIVQVGGESTATWAQVQKKLENAGGRAIPFTIERRGEQQALQFDVPVAIGENENPFSASRQVGQVPGLTQESRSTLVGVRDPKSPAGQAGVQSLLLIVSVNGQKVSYWRDLERVIRETSTPESQNVTLQLRELEKPDKSENLQSVQIPLTKGWSEKMDLLASLGLEPAELYIYQVKKGSPADTAGLVAKDRVVRIAGEDVHTWSDVLARVKTFTPASEGLDFTVVRNGEEKTFKIKPEMTTLMSSKGQEEHRFTIGIVSGFFPMGPDTVFFRLSNPVKMVQHGLKETMYWTEFVVMSLVRLVQGEVSAKNIGGVITIGRVAAHSFAAGLSAFMRMMGLISINLFLLNLLPIPILDGGHLVFYTIEALRGAPLSMRKMEIAQQVGLMLLMLLMAFAFFNDISNFWVNRM
jgi:regulator of sigma E protease